MRRLALILLAATALVGCDSQTSGVDSRDHPPVFTTTTTPQTYPNVGGPPTTTRSAYIPTPTTRYVSAADKRAIATAVCESRWNTHMGVTHGEWMTSCVAFALIP
jgi:hypothetical protein